MTVKTPIEPDYKKSDFERQAESEASGVVGEFWDFIRHNKKWWLTPIILVLLAVGALLVVSGGAVAPFIYTLF